MSDITLENNKKFKIRLIPFVMGLSCLILGATVHHDMISINICSIIIGLILMLLSIKEEN